MVPEQARVVPRHSGTAASRIEWRRMSDQRCVDEVSTRELFAFAEDGIRQATERLWPDRRVEVAEHVPSITGYVRRMLVDDAVVYAKTSILGVSLVSIVR